MKDPASRPEVSSHVDNMDQYDTVFVGFPIWWYVAPPSSIPSDEYDFSGKTVIPLQPPAAAAWARRWRD